jgi:hypothetical protein
MQKISKCGILLRGYAKTFPEVEVVAARLFRSASQACILGFKAVVILVPKDKDCGQTVEAINTKFSYGKVTVLNPEGNENSDVLNEGLACLKERECKYAFIVSNKALPFLSVANVNKMLEAFDRGALVAGLAVRDEGVSLAEDDHYFGILSGRLSNTFCAWNISALSIAGNFDSKIGVEEIAPIMRLIETRGICIAPVFPDTQSTLDITDLRAQYHSDLMSTKKKRQLQEVERAGGTFSLIERGILRGYPC